MRDGAGSGGPSVRDRDGGAGEARPDDTPVPEPARVGAYMNDQEEDAKQHGPNRGSIGPDIELGPPSVVSLLRLGQGANFLRIAGCDYPGSVESGLGNGNMHSAADVDADPLSGPGIVHIPLPLPAAEARWRHCSRLSGGRNPVRKVAAQDARCPRRDSGNRTSIVGPAGTLFDDERLDLSMLGCDIHLRAAYVNGAQNRRSRRACGPITRRIEGLVGRVRRL